MSDPLAALAQIAQREAWLVGGAVRDRLLGRTTSDYDVAVQEAPERIARGLGRAASGHPFRLSEGFGAWRVVAHDRSWQLDLLPLGGETIEHDLARRDLTVNAIAQPLRGGDYVDPFGGLGDLRERRLRMVSAQAFALDPLRALRLARLAGELGFEVDAASAAAARGAAHGLAGVAAERVFAELKQIISAEAPLEGLALMDELGVSEVILPELSRLRGVEQSKYHHLDVAEHTRAVLAQTLALERDPERLFAEHAPAITALLAEPLANELTRGQALRFGALFHDIAKPQTREVTPAGRVTFIGHDASGAELARAVLARLRASERLGEHVAALTAHHLRLGFLVHQMPLGRRAVYQYLLASEPVQVDVTLLSVADRLATRGAGAEVAIERHLELARRLMGDALAWRTRRPRPPVRGNELVRALGVVPGPELGRVLGELEQAAFAGEITTREQALARARELLGLPAGADR